ncbi:MAG: type VI secretion system tube protein Hcp [Aquabacterium sp.]|uniref:Hcp family type VI secretion system effector n=1 Tax=Aquabacterium sp. TaxID=1872578 RepID=UPI00120967E2|nr:type VI secretion system tube protein Hcp [Aquabacterium sp.]TAK93452.1 MAG: type VI secretion system tube protein Hcp [Aquabacterium sp.]
MSQADMFLKIEGTRQGPIKGESTDTNHIDEIEVLGWSWGMDVSAASFGASSARTTMQELVVRKRVDRASTALMSALRANEPLKKVTLTVRKAGGAASVDYLKISLEKARVMSHKLGTTVDGLPDIHEELRIAFFKVNVQYQPQTATGGGGGATTFETEITPA